MIQLLCASMALLLLGGCGSIQNTTNPTGAACEQTAIWKSWSPTPPMGWNSWDSYFGCITEHQFRNIVDVLAEKMLPWGYEYAVVDMGWFHPGPEGWDMIEPVKFHVKYEGFNEQTGQWEPELTMDQYGRFLPDLKRFPSAAGGKGFKPLADYTHSKGMKFGIHIMRGIPRAAVLENTPVKGTDLRAADIAAKEDFGHWWNNYMFGVDGSQPGAQEYYNSLFDLYASWGVDYVKVDDIMVPKYHALEIEMIRKAIDQCGRPMVVSLSCGEVQASYAHHLQQNANLWRISIDVWDEWADVDRVLDLAHYWSPFIGGGTWPDCDMIPIGRLALAGTPGVHRGGPRDSKLSPEEQKSLMTLWAITRSPLMWGGDPLTTPDEDLALLRNREVLAVNQNSINNRQNWFGYGDGPRQRVWVADIPDSSDKYVALLNFEDRIGQVMFEFRTEELKGKYKVRDLWAQQDLGVYEEKFVRTLPAHGSGLYRLSQADPDAAIVQSTAPYEIHYVAGTYTLRPGGQTISDLKVLVNGYNVIKGGRDWGDGKYVGPMPGADVELQFDGSNPAAPSMALSIENTSKEDLNIHSVTFLQAPLSAFSGSAQKPPVFIQSDGARKRIQNQTLETDSAALLQYPESDRVYLLGFRPMEGQKGRILADGARNHVKAFCDLTEGGILLAPGQTVKIGQLVVSTADTLQQGLQQMNELQ